MNQILVTGPQRSGTTFTAHILARGLNLPYVDEQDFNAHDVPDNCVIQAPYALKYVIELSFKHPNLHFIYVIRDLEEIKKSMERIKWCKDWIDNQNYYEAYITHCKLLWSSHKLILTEDRWTEIDYNILKSHPLYVDNRSNFTVRQWESNKPIGPKTWTHDRYAKFTQE